MSYEARISMIEARQEMNQIEFDRLHLAVDALRLHSDQSFAGLRAHTDQSIAELRAHTDQSIAELRIHNDQSLAEVRTHTDQSIAELRRHTDQGFDELRRELRMGMRWMMGMWLTTIAMYASLAGRTFGLY